MTKHRKGNPVVQVGRAFNANGNEITLASGVRARIRPVSAKLLDAVARTVPEPEVPKQFVESVGREEENPLHPAYLRAIEEANHLRGTRTTEALMLFGVDLLDPIPPDEEWLPKLRYLEGRGMLNLEDYDFSDQTEKELCYKSFIAITGPDLVLVTMASGLTEQEVADAEDSFQRPQARHTHPDAGDKPSAETRGNVLPEV